MKLRPACLFALLALAASATTAQSLLRGEVVHIGGADNVTVQADGGNRVRVRIEGILPPATPPAAQQGRNALGRLLLGQPVSVHASDPAGRTSTDDTLPARLVLAGEEAALWMVRAGYARAAPDRTDLLAAESEARRMGRGLWAGGAQW